MATRNEKVAAGVVAGVIAAVAGALAFLFPWDAKADGKAKKAGLDEKKPDDKKSGDGFTVIGKRVRPYPLPRPYAPSATVCYRTKQPFNRAILGTPEQVVAVLKWLGVTITLDELLASDALAKSPLWPKRSKKKAPRRSPKLQAIQAVGRSMGLRGHAGAPPSAVDGIWGECTALTVEDLAELAEQGKAVPL